MYSSTSISEKRSRSRIYLFLLIVSLVLLLVALLNRSNWGWREHKRFESGNIDLKTSLLFENRLLTPKVLNWLYKRGISTRPNYAVVGEDKWLYLGDNFEYVLTKAGGSFPWPSQEGVDRWSNQLLQRQQWLQDQGVISQFAVAPNKHTIYPEHAPAWYPFRPPELTRYLVARAQLGGTHIVDTAPAIQAQRCCTEWLYSKTDSHWTLPAAYLAYQRIMRAIANQVPTIVSLEDSSISFQEQQAPAGGLARMLGISQLYRNGGDIGHTLDIKPSAQRICARNTSVDFKLTGDCEPIADKNMQAGLYAVKRLSNPDALNDMSVLIVTDSYGLAPSRYFNHSFKTIWHAHLGYILNGDRLKQFVKIFKPDIILYMVIERNLLRPIVYEFDGKSNIVSPIIE